MFGGVYVFGRFSSSWYADVCLDGAGYGSVGWEWGFFCCVYG
jgi:hypothetical protein